jgi:hypothetical protein
MIINQGNESVIGGDSGFHGLRAAVITDHDAFNFHQSRRWRSLRCCVRQTQTMSTQAPDFGGEQKTISPMHIEHRLLLRTCNKIALVRARVPASENAARSLRVLYIGERYITTMVSLAAELRV